MANTPITDTLIEDIIKSTGPYDEDITTTQGIRLQYLVKLIRDHLQDKLNKEGDTMDGTLTLTPGTVTDVPLKLSPGGLTTVPQDGAIERGNDGELYFTNGSTRKAIGSGGNTVPDGVAQVIEVVHSYNEFIGVDGGPDNGKFRDPYNTILQTYLSLPANQSHLLEIEIALGGYSPSGQFWIAVQGGGATFGVVNYTSERSIIKMQAIITPSFVHTHYRYKLEEGSYPIELDQRYSISTPGNLYSGVYIYPCVDSSSGYDLKISQMVIKLTKNIPVRNYAPGDGDN